MNIFRPLAAGLGLALFSLPAWSQEASQNWMLQDYTQDKVYGMSVEKAYPLLKGRTPKKVIVAVIDSGVDVDHEDLKDVIWTNTDEIPNNGIDDDKNGYADDVHGWNFIGGKDGRNVNHDTYEITRLYVAYGKKYAGSNGGMLKGAEKKEFEEYQKIKTEIETKIAEYKAEKENFDALVEQMQQSLKDVKKRFNMSELNSTNIQEINVDEKDSMATSLMMLKLMFMFAGDDEKEMMNSLQEGADYYNNALMYGYNTEFNPRDIVGDNYADSYERSYGNNDLKGPDPSHGTHVAGIIAGKRGNGIGLDGIADNVEIMVVRVVPDGDERDKDVANGIRYAVDNGARIINMSFGKSYAYDKTAVDEAVKYGEKKGVLFIHAAGNDSKNLDSARNFPTRKYLKGGAAKNWLEIGAMGWQEAPGSVGSFSNYGKKTVDIFAPGVDIYSTVPGNEYRFENGTSMAAPSTSGVAAVLMSYFPDLKASQIKAILMKTAARYPGLMVSKPGSEELVDFKELSISGGEVNLYNAVQEALKSAK